jgi:hypothetical protein
MDEELQGEGAWVELPDSEYVTSNLAEDVMTIDATFS